MAEGLVHSEGTLHTEDGRALTSMVLPSDVTITGEIKTGHPLAGGAGFDNSKITFGGIQNEARIFPAGEMSSPTASRVFTGGVPRLSCANGADTSIYGVFEIEEWWFRQPASVGMYMEWCNDHSATGSVLFNFAVHEYDIGIQGPGTGTQISSRLAIIPDVPAGLSTTTEICSIALGNPAFLNPGPFSSFYTFLIQRLAANPADTLEGPIGIIAANMTRGQ